MSDLDEATGLPVIPKGYRWNVSEETISSYAYMFIQPGCLSSGHLLVSLEKSRNTTWTEVERPVVWFPFYKRTVVRSETKWSSVASQRVEGAHPIAVRNAAHKALKAFKARNARDSLKGIYPPKRLVP